MAHVNEIVHIQCLNHKYEDGTMVDVCDTHFCVLPGEIVIISGPNGSGKSTLLNHIVGILKPTKGEVKVLGVDVTDKDFKTVLKDIGVVFQNVDEQLIAPSVYDEVSFTPLNYGIGNVDELVQKVLEKLKLEYIKNKVPHLLSGGEKKKVALAGAVVMRPKLLVLDELFANLDQKSKNDIADYLGELNKTFNTTIILTCHEDDIIKRLNARIFPVKKVYG